MACVYQIRNLINGKFYIGSTCGTFKKRKGEHLTELQKGYHKNKYLLASWRKYGEENFQFSVIEEFRFPEEYTKDYIYEYVTLRELYYINSWNPQYNLTRETSTGKLGRKLTPEECKRIGDRVRGTKHTPEAIKKIKEARATQIITEEHKRKIGEKSKGNQYCLGHKQSEEQKQKTREQVLRNNKNGIGMHSIESKEKRTKTLKIVFNSPEMKEQLKVTARNRNRKLFLCFKTNEFVGEFSNQTEAAEALGFSKPWGISAVLNNEQKTHKGYTFKYKDN